MHIALFNNHFFFQTLKISRIFFKKLTLVQNFSYFTSLCQEKLLLTVNCFLSQFFPEISKTKLMYLVHAYHRCLYNVLYTQETAEHILSLEVGNLWLI